MKGLTREGSSASVLSINAGSSSIKFALFRIHGGSRSEPKGSEARLDRILGGKVSRIGSGDSTLSFKDPVTGEEGSRPMGAMDSESAGSRLLDWLGERVNLDSIRAVGHRVVHGMDHTDPEILTPELSKKLNEIGPYDPDHLPGELRLMEGFRAWNPELLQVACFDTAFHRSMPEVARRLPLPRRYESRGLQRYGFHGLSYAYLLEELAREAGREVAGGRVILGHLGSGASLAAVQEGHSIDTSMAFTPTAGLPMGTRPGDLDPGVAWYLFDREGLSPREFSDLINHKSGLLGISETSSDMRDLLDRESADHRAAEAVESFCYQTRKWIGAFAAALGGVDTLVFSGGIGENSPEIRGRVCEGLGFLGIDLDPAKNRVNAPVISSGSAGVTVRVIPTDEEQMIARMTIRLLQGQGMLS